MHDIYLVTLVYANKANRLEDRKKLGTITRDARKRQTCNIKHKQCQRGVDTRRQDCAGLESKNANDCLEEYLGQATGGKA
jgi:hypothetical protein